MFVRPKIEEHHRARELRGRGWSLNAIAKELRVAKSSVSVWVRDVQVPPARVQTKKAHPPLLMLSGHVKRCGRCRQALPVEMFSRHPTERRQFWCRECFRAYFRQRGSKHRAQVNAGRNRRVERARDHLLLKLEESRCRDCGESHVVVLEFDHVRGRKSADLARLVGDGARLREIDEEAAKCDVVCANCHRRRTAHRVGSWRQRAYRGESVDTDRGISERRNLSFVLDRLKSHHCVDCGEADVRTLEFDHVDAKRFSVMVGVWRGYALERIRGEVGRCQIRCANCHRLRTAEQHRHYRYVALLVSDVDVVPPDGVEPPSRKVKACRSDR